MDDYKPLQLNYEQHQRKQYELFDTVQLTQQMLGPVASGMINWVGKIFDNNLSTFLEIIYNYSTIKV